LKGGLGEEATRSAAATANSLGLPTTKVSKVKRGSSLAPSSSSGLGSAATRTCSTARITGDAVAVATGGGAFAATAGRTLSAIERTLGLIEVHKARIRSA
jgi:hypothetical protein